ncbi:MAG: hypothetical protein Fur0040_04470 [Sideroxydans sp.]
MPAMSRRLLVFLLLACALLFVQQGALLHGLSHTLAEQKQSLPHDQACELCVAYAQVGSAVGSSPLQIDFGPASVTMHEVGQTSPRAFPCPAFAARAPPAA